MPIEYTVLKKKKLRSPRTYSKVNRLAEQFLYHLQRPAVVRKIKAVHKLGASSAEVQAVVLPGATLLGFTDEKKGLFAAYEVAALRPDYYLKVDDSGVLLEVERGKTTTNNMDLLDFWKCHICEHADYLFLLVPQERKSNNGKILYHFNQVHRRLATFFLEPNLTNVEAVFIFGY